MSYDAKILLDSVSESGNRLTTMEVTFPRIVLAEFNTHRVFSRNSASSRAIPVLTQLMRIEENPFIPIYWGKNQSGMQADVELSVNEQELAVAIWLAARGDMLLRVRELLDLGVHKQIANRLLEPFMWHTVIVTSTEWSNFFALRANPMAQPEIRRIAEMMQALYDTSEPTVIERDEWHLPLIQPEEADLVTTQPGMMRQISAARCARVSYLTHDGKRDLDADLTLYKRLVSGGHMSPLEHVATPYGTYTKKTVGDSYGRVAEVQVWEPAWSGNFYGWKQLRKFIPCEDDFSKVEKSE